MHKRQIYSGQIYKNISGETFQVEEYINSKKVLIKFLDENSFQVWCKSSDILRGKIKNPYTKNIHGIGYIGVGQYVSQKSNGKMTKEYSQWTAMFERCYSINKYKTYKNCYVIEEWHNFQKFAEWCNNQIGFKEKGWELDKDILVKDNKIYGPNFCRFVPKHINLILNTSRGKRGQYPVGVYFHRKSGKYMARCGNKYLGIYENPEEAFYMYKQEKELQIKNLVESYREKLDLDIYKKLINHEVKIDD